MITGNKYSCSYWAVQMIRMIQVRNKEPGMNALLAAEPAGGNLL